MAADVNDRGWLRNLVIQAGLVLLLLCCAAPVNACLEGLAWGMPLLRDGCLVQRGILDADAVGRFTSRESPKRSWLLLAAELWARRWLEGQDVAALRAEAASSSRGSADTAAG